MVNSVFARSDAHCRDDVSSTLPGKGVSAGKRSFVVVGRLDVTMERIPRGSSVEISYVRSGRSLALSIASRCGQKS